MSPAFLQHFLESLVLFAFLRAYGAGTSGSPPPRSEMLAQYVWCRAVADTLPPCFKEKCNVEKSSVTVPVNDAF